MGQFLLIITDLQEIYLESQLNGANEIDPRCSACVRSNCADTRHHVEPGINLETISPERCCPTLLNFR